MVEVMKIMSTSLNRSHAHTSELSVPDPAAGHCWPTPPLRFLDTHRKVWVSLLWGHCSFLLGPGAHKVLFVPPRVYFSVLCMLWQLYGGVNVPLSSVKKTIFAWKPAFLQDSCQSFYGPGHSLCAIVISSCMLWVRGVVPVSEFWDISFLQF